MMKCLTQTEIEATLNVAEDKIPADWERHLSQCIHCQQQMEASVGSADDWQMTCQTLNESSSEIQSIPTKVNGKYESTIFYRLNFESSEANAHFAEESGSQERSNLNVQKEQPSLGVELDAPSHPENMGRVGRYEIERIVGRGGMGVVFKGFDAELNRPVAIKILSPHLSHHGTARQRFTREAKAAAAVVHDNVVPIFDIQSDPKQPYLVMPYVTGVSLEDYVDSQGQIGTKNILRVALQIACGLAAAHSQGLIHRDIKPGNILLENGLNRVQITDFGLARAVDDAAMTHSGMIAGTPHYMSPEQAKGETLDQRSDLFSLGCVMYFMATGRTLHRGDGPYSVMAQLCRGDYIPVREINSNIPAFVADIIDKLLEKEAQHRFQSAAQLAQHLEKSLAYLQHPTVQKAPRRIWSSRKKKTWQRIAWGSFASLATAAILIFGLPLMFGQTPNQNQPTQANAEKPTTPPISLMPMSDLQNDLAKIENELAALELQLLGSGPAFEFNDGTGLENELQSLESAVLQEASGLNVQPNTGWNHPATQPRLFQQTLQPDQSGDKPTVNSGNSTFTPAQSLPSNQQNDGSTLNSNSLKNSTENEDNQ